MSEGAVLVVRDLGDAEGETTLGGLTSPMTGSEAPAAAPVGECSGRGGCGALAVGYADARWRRRVGVGLRRLRLRFPAACVQSRPWCDRWCRRRGAGTSDLCVGQGLPCPDGH